MLRFVILEVEPVDSDQARMKFEDAGLCLEKTYTDPKPLINDLPRTRPDIILVDPAGIKYFGVDVMARIRYGWDENLKIIFWSEEPNPAAVFAALSNGADGFIEKRVGDLDYLLSAIDGAMNGNQIFSKGLINGNLLDVGRASMTINSARLLYEWKITERELDVCRGLVDGETAVSDGRRLGVSNETIKTHRANLYKKLKVKNQNQARNLILSL